MKTRHYLYFVLWEDTTPKLCSPGASQKSSPGPRVSVTPNSKGHSWEIAAEWGWAGAVGVVFILIVAGGMGLKGIQTSASPRHFQQRRIPDYTGMWQGLFYMVIKFSAHFKRWNTGHVTHRKSAGWSTNQELASVIEWSLLRAKKWDAVRKCFFKKRSKHEPTPKSTPDDFFSSFCFEGLSNV